MAILLTGGLGYIGSHIALKLKKKAIIIDNQSNSNLNYKKKLPYAKVYKLELNYKNLNKIFKNHSIKSVIHLAGIKSVEQSNQLPLKYYRNNVISSIELIECMDKFKINNLIFSSSATVYGDSYKSPLEEELALKTTNAYASNKIAIEQLIKEYSISNHRFKSISLRYFNPGGSDVKMKLSEQPLGKPQNLLPILNRAVKQKKLLKIFGNDYPTNDGTCVRDYIHIKDLADAHLIALKKISKFKGHNPINIGMGKGLSVLEIVNLFEKVNKVKVRYVFTKRRKGDAAISFANNYKAKKLLDWSPKFSHKDILKDSWEAYLLNNSF